VNSERFCPRWYVLWQHWYVCFIVICVLCQCPLPVLKCCLLFDLWVASPRPWWMACMW